MILMEEVYDVFTFLNRFGFQLIEFIVIAALVVLAVFLGAKLRKATNQLKANKAAKEEAMESAQATKEE